MKLWKGIEVEGVYLGIKTLFIGDSSITFNEIKEQVDKDSDIEQLYFGAGQCTKINVEVLRLCVEHFKHKVITAEINLNDLYMYSNDLLRLISNVIITITHKNIYMLKGLNDERVQIKLQTLEPKENKYLSIGQYDEFLETNMDEHYGKIYSGDEVLKW